METHDVHIPENAARIMGTLGAAGHESFIVGGAGRDAMRGRPLDDIDIASSAEAHEAMRVLEEAGAHVIPTGIKHGTITAVLDGESFEVTTFRVDGSYSDARHPDSVALARCIEEDLARRDFTVNAMAYNGSRGLVDPFGGRADLERGIIRCVGEPARRFSEDALRILRALRFSAQLGFEIEGGTARAARDARQLLEHVSRERIGVEFAKTVSASAGAGVLGLFSDIVAVFLPEISRVPRGRGAWNGGLRALGAIESDELAVRLAALLGGFEDRAAMLTGLRYPNDLVARCVAVADAATRALPSSTYEAKLLLRDYGPDVVPPSLALHEAAGGEDAAEALALVGEVLREGACYTRAQLAVGGADVMRILGASGREVGRILDDLLDRVMRCELPNDRDALIAELSQRAS